MIQYINLLYIDITRGKISFPFRLLKIFKFFVFVYKPNL